MKNYIILSVFAFALVATACNSNDKSDMTANVENTAIQKENMNTSIHPGDDFFRYANGGWMAANPIPEEYSRFGAFEVLDKMNKDRIKSLIEEVSQQEDAKKGSPAQQIRDFTMQLWILLKSIILALPLSFLFWMKSMLWNPSLMFQAW
jgi:putative endopeptidase